ncbi:hypothetical protein ACJ2A9_11775 [Anaerobacillus sp. MEB173]|uniref:hypothetical protein n=1 Tax=Anaerobacillus sp. MEB173 TaxID=3383345 RepID=UPI003F9114AC
MMKKILNRVWLSGILLMIVTVVLIACNDQQPISNMDVPNKDSIYEDKEIEIIVPFEAGGGTDLFARFMAHSLSENLTGNPSIQVLNIEGDNTIIGTNEFIYMSEPNGYRLFASSASVHTPYLLGQRAVKYDLRDLEPIIGVPTGGVVYVSPKTGVTKPTDLLNPEEPLIFTGISATGLDLVTLLSFEVLGIDVLTSFDIHGRKSSSVLFEQGSSTIDFQTTFSYLTHIAPLVEKQKAIPLFSFGQINEQGKLIRDPIFNDLPTLEEVYIEIYGESPSGEAWEAYKAFVNSSYTIQKLIWTHSDAPDAAVEALHEAAERAVNDSYFYDQGQDVLLNYEPYTGQELKVMIDNAFNTSPEILNWVRELLNEKYGIKN